MPFTPIQTFLGGLLLHFSTSSLLEDTGRVFGVSGIVDGAVFGSHERWQWGIIVGLLAGPAFSYATGLQAYYPGNALHSIAQIGLGRLGLAGALVGFGSRLGSGCTSGHMLCGVSRLSPRSLIATITFFATAVLSAKLFPLGPSSNLSDPAIPAYAYTLDQPSFAAIAVFIGLIAGLKIAYAALSRYVLSTASFRSTPYVLSGLMFSIGLSMSGMSDPAKVLGFLRLFDLTQFDPSLALIMLSGVLLNGIHYARLKHTAKARFPWESWRVPTRKDVGSKLILGSAAFGVGWGLIGICPGPALVAFGESVIHNLTVTGKHDSLLGIITFLGAMLGGMRISRLF
ncbi:uncharacterized protein I303_101175 [Kwoniella dejecticola CBS 10117]|uniref:Sulphur transport domain-containing protein n=1 Tax=Kwoniella dejecticola CBS 10117 TaxID=1296121 RepID=A0A1A6AGZ4_9TREE|nr:uncharacterized protein I303_01182 [Kwoniella dejecticola CBS 10117]OBR89355.1 hypothetical protein I303_01182 [Kwoniella dejecticola CBS 10117]